MAITQVDRIASVTTPLGGEVLLLHRMTGKEQLSQLFEYELELLSEDNAIKLDQLLGKSMTVTLNLTEGGQRLFNGLVTRVSQFGMMGKLYVYRATLHPKLWLLTRSSNCRIMPKDLSIPDIVTEVMKKHGVTDVESKLFGKQMPREYCVQYRETDFNFISRLLEEEGIYYFFKHTEKTHTLVLCDSKQSHQDMPASTTVVYFPLANENRRKAEHIYEWHLSQEIQSGTVQLYDYDFEKPAAKLEAETSLLASHSEAGKKIYDYPGEYKEPDEAKRYSGIRVQAQRAQYEQISMRGNVRRLAVGTKFTLDNFPRADQNREYLVVSENFQIQNNEYESQAALDGGDAFQCAGSVLSTGYVYRPPRLARIPVVQGVQTAVVVGLKGEEIYTDKYGRIKVQFHWDREGKNDENSSCWVRVAQVWAGKRWGAQFIPRVGQEVLVDFLEGNPDCPIVVGSVYNAEQMPPYVLEDNKTQSGIKSRSSKGAGSENFNEIRFEDKKGDEELYIHAEKDATRIVENNDVQKIGLDKHSPGNQTVDIHNNRTVTLKQGNDTLKVQMGNRTVKVDLGKITEEAMQSIELKVGQSSIKIDQSGVTIKGMIIKIEGQCMTEVKGLVTTVNANALLTVKGGVVMIN